MFAEATIEPIQQELADLLSAALVNAWNTHRVVQMQTYAGALTNVIWKPLSGLKRGGHRTEGMRSPTCMTFLPKVYKGVDS